MKMKRRAAIATVAMVSFTLFALANVAAGQVRVVTYNVAQLKGDIDAMKEVFTALHEDDSHGFAAPVSVFIFQEVRAEDVTPIGTALFQTSPAGVDYVPATYTNFNKDTVAGAQLCYYDFSQLSEIAAEHEDIFTGAGRYGDRWKFQLNGYTSPDASFYIYSMHLKAGDSMAEMQQRLDGIENIIDDVATLPLPSHVIIGGDFNFQHNAEPGYEFLVAPADELTEMVDPLGTGSWSGPANAIKHTQSPRDVNIGGLVGGGLDDRFDLLVANLQCNDDDGIALIENTYRAFGNDGNHYNQAINSGNNTYFSGDVPASNALADALFNASDHIPVVCDFQVPAVMFATMPSNFGNVIAGGEVNVSATILNVADVVDVAGADELEYVATASGDLSGIVNDSVEALGEQSIVQFSVNTDEIGAVSGTVSLDVLSEGAQAFQSHLTTQGNVLQQANPSFSEDEDINQVSIEQSYAADSGSFLLNVEVFNFEYSSSQALLDIDAIDGIAAPLSVAGKLPQGIGSSPGELAFLVNTERVTPGLYEISVAVQSSDEDLPGESTHQLDIDFSITIESGGCDADIAGNDQVVDTSDLLELLASWGACPEPCENGCGADITGDCQVNTEDLLALLSAWGPCPTP